MRLPVVQGRRQPGLAVAAVRLRDFLLGPPVAGAVPERTRRVIAELEARSEVLVCAVQIAAIVAFAVLYTLSPKAFPPDVPFEPVPVALAAYSLFTGLRLYLALSRRLGPAFLSLSVVVDMAVLMLTIWSFHLQYQAPPALSLKAPTLMYAFILIALRALRFESRYVLLAGATAALGWLLILAYAILYPGPQGMAVTGSFAAYTMSHMILPGAELDKIVSLTLVALILAVVVIRARRLLLTATVERLAGQELARFFAPEVASAIRRSDVAIAPGEGVSRDAAVLVTDLRGFTALAAELPPAATIALLNEYQARLVPIITRHGGSIDKYLGDGILASFGAAAQSPTFAAHALRAADAILAASAAWAEQRAAQGQQPLPIGAAVATGRLLFGAVGDASRLEYTIIGEPVNLAAKLEKATKREGVRALTTAAALAEAEAQGYAPAAPKEHRPRRKVEGVGEPVDLVVLG